MSYNSLFDQSSALRLGYKHKEKPSDSSISPFEYNGTLEEVIRDLMNLTHFPRTEKEIEKLATHPQKIIRVCIDYKINHPKNSFVEELVSEAINFSLNIYSLGSCSKTRLKCLIKKIEKTGNGEILMTPLIQPYDSITFSSSSGHTSREATEKLVKEVGKKDLLFIALGHGGIAPGMDVFLRYKDYVQTDDGFFYVIRYSQDKKGDRNPQVSKREMTLLQNESKKRDILVFDEDMGKHETMLKACSFFLDNIFKDKFKISGMVNRYKMFYSNLGRESLKKYSLK